MKRWFISINVFILIQAVVWISWLYRTESKDFEASILRPSSHREFYRFEQNRPFTEYMLGAQAIKKVDYADLDSILLRCLEVENDGHEQKAEDWNNPNKPKIELKSLVDIALNSNGTFRWFVLQVYKDDQDMAREFTSPKLYGEPLCTNLNESEAGPYCRPNWTDDVPDFPKKKELRIPNLVCTRSAAVNRFGFIRKDKFQIVPTPKYRYIRDDSVRSPFQIVSDPVFTIAQFPGDEVYHHIVECLSRLAPFYDQLMKNPEIKIHITTKKFLPFMTFLGFPEERILDEHVLTSSVVIYPDPHPTKQAYIVRKLSTILRRRLAMYFPDLVRNKHIVIIRRSRTRSITNFDEMVQALKQRFPNETFVLYRDDPTPSVPDTFRMFYEAKMIIAPHGAGLSNTLVSNPGTPIIELLTDDRKKLNLCFVDLSRALGFHHEAFSPPGSKHFGTFTVDPRLVIKLASKYL